MSTGDIKGSRRRIKQLKKEGHYPKASGLSVHALAAKHKIRAEAEAKRRMGKKK